MTMNPNYLAELARKVGKEWHILAYELGFSSAQVDCLQIAYPYNNNQCVTTFLTKWHDTVSSQNQKPLPLLAKAFSSVGRSDIADEIAENFNVVNGCREAYEVDTTLTDALRKVTFGHKTSDLHTYIEQSERYMEFHLKEKHLFVKTKAAKIAEDRLLNSRAVNLMGNAGDGKTTIAAFLLSQMKAQGCTIIVLTDPALIERIYDDEKQILYFVDDAFGTPTVNHSLVETWTRLHDKIQGLLECQKCRLLMATRKHVYQKCEKYFSKCPIYTENIVDLTFKSHTLTVTEKNLMIATICDGVGLFPKNLKFTKADYIPGFPLLCKMYARDKTLQMADDYFEKTLKLLRQQIELLAETQPHAFCGLVMIMVFDGSLSRDVFNPFDPCDEDDMKKIRTILKAYGLNESSELTKVEKHLEEMSGVYVEDVDEQFRFLHDTIFDTTCLVFGSKYPNEIVRIASPKFVETRIRTSGIPGSYIEDEDIIILNKSKYPALATRWIKDTKEGYISNICDNPSIHDEEILKVFIKKMDGLKENEFLNLLTSSDKNEELTLLGFSCKRGIFILVKYLVEKMNRLRELNPDRNDLQISTSLLLHAVTRNHVDITSVLLENGLDVNTVFNPLNFQCLHLACKNENLKMVKTLIKHGANISASDFYKKQPIHYACEKGNLQILSTLLNKGASVFVRDNSGKEPIHYAGMTGSLACMKLLVEKGAIIKSRDSCAKETIHYAATSQSPDVMSFLLESSKFDVDKVDSMGLSVLHYACRAASSANVELLLKQKANVHLLDFGNSSPLHAACKGGHNNPKEADRCVQLLLGKDAEVNLSENTGKTALHHACQWSRDRRLGSVKLLLRYGAEVNIEDRNGHLPIYYACESNSLQSLKLLVDYGANVNFAGSQGKHPIHYACMKGNAEIVSLLLSKGAKINAMDDKGKMPIHYASQHGNIDCLLFLLDKEADPNVPDDSGLRPLHYACKWSRQSTVWELLRAGADPSACDKKMKTPSEALPKWSSSRTRIQRLLRGNSFHSNH